MPELFGSAYILPAIIVVVLLVALLAILTLRKGKASGASKKAGTPAARVGPVTPSGPADGGGGSSADAKPRSAYRSPPTLTTGTATGLATSALAAPRPGTSSTADPLRVVINDILQGWGDLSREDTRRIEVFRPDKVRAAVEATQLPKDLKNGEYARTRLTQLRQYAADLELKTQHAEPEAAGPEVEPEPAPQWDLDAPPDQPKVEMPPEPDIGIAAVAGAPWKLAEDPTLGRLAHRYVEEAPVFLSEAPIFVEEVPDTVEEPIFKEVTEAGNVPAQTDLLWSRTPAPENSLRALHKKVTSAGELMAIPVEERPDMVAFLEPPELAKVFEATEDPALKKTIIDMLENVGNPASLDVLRRCLDDPDRDVQLYALEAADRLLGVD